MTLSAVWVVFRGSNSTRLLRHGMAGHIVEMVGLSWIAKPWGKSSRSRKFSQPPAVGVGPGAGEAETINRSATSTSRCTALEDGATIVGQRDLVGTDLREELVHVLGAQPTPERLGEGGGTEGGATAELAELAVALELALVVPLIGGRLLRELLVLQLVLADVAAVGRQHHRLDPHQATDRLGPRRGLPAE